jgi:quinol-cytochrome oxidoreductase complex cytochrome b subunit
VSKKKKRGAAEVFGTAPQGVKHPATAESSAVASPSQSSTASLAASLQDPPAKKPSGLANLLLHLHPRVIPRDALRLCRTFGLGGMALALFLVLVITGALILFAYEPSIERAYASVLELQDDAPFGAFVRGIHFWAGNGLLVVAFLHLLRVFYTGAFLPPRRLNWGLGLVMLVIVMAANFTGYLLPWDQLAFWAVTIGTGMLQYVPLVGEGLVHMARGGPDVSSKTLSLFFVLHIALLPILLFLLTMCHFWLVRKAGGIMVPKSPGHSASPKPDMISVRPNLTFKEGIAALALLAVILTIAAMANAPLEEQANAGMSPNPAKAPWYFMGIQELLVHLHPAFAVLVVPILVAAFAVGLPFFHYREIPAGTWFHSARGRKVALLAASGALVLTPAAVLLDEFFLHWNRLFPGFPLIISTGLIPMVLWAGVSAVLLVALKLSARASLLEIVQAIFTFVVVALIVLTVVGVFFRGDSMRLVWP